MDYSLIDGALATELEAHGADLNHPLWSAKVLMEDPSLIERVHSDYYAAGADLATTASYQLSFEGVAQTYGKDGTQSQGCDELAEKLLRRSVEIAMNSRCYYPNKLVAASIGPYGAILCDGSEYRGEYRITDQQLADFHRKRMEILVDCKPDLIAIETIPSLREGVAICGVLERFSGMRGWLSYSCKDGGHSCEGQEIEACARVGEGCQQIIGVGFNCTAPECAVPLIQKLKKATVKSIICYPNSGEGWDSDAQQWVATKSKLDCVAWYETGARVIGGCCRTNPRDIQLMKAKLTSLLGRQRTKWPLHV